MSVCRLFWFVRRYWNGDNRQLHVVSDRVTITTADPGYKHEIDATYWNGNNRKLTDAITTGTQQEDDVVDEPVVETENEAARVSLLNPATVVISNQTDV